MSNKTVLILLALAIMLGGVALLLLKPPQSSGTEPTNSTPVIETGARILDFAPSGVWRIKIDEKGESITIARASAASSLKPPAWASDADWLMTKADWTIPWPVPTAQVQGLLRVLGDSRCVAPPPAGSQLEPGASTITLDMRDGSTRTLRISSRTIGGMGLVETAESVPARSGQPSDKPVSPALVRTAMASDDLYRLCTAPGPGAWRDRFPLASLAPEAARVRLESAGKTISLARVDGRWIMREPVAAPGDAGAISGLLATLAKVQIASFDASSPGASAATPAAPLAQVLIEQDRRTLGSATDASPNVQTLAARLVVNAPANAQGTRLLGAIDGVPLTLIANELVAISHDPGAYVSPAPMSLLSPDVASVELSLRGTKVRFSRADVRWKQLIPATSEAYASDLAGQAIEELLRFLSTGTLTDRPPGDSRSGGANPGATNRPAITLNAPEDAQPTGSIDVESPGGREHIDIFTTAEPVRLILRTGPVVRTFPVASLPKLLQPGTPEPAPSSAPPTAPPPLSNAPER